jgi:predicted unusual protein kinase regulating ubiquinone biosynthesis (AarF/ABC1/UbiB family)
VAETLYRFIFGSITRYGVFNGDPHPGNYLFQGGGKVVFLDFGCVKYFPVEMRRNWRALQASHIAGDRGQFRDKLVSLGFFRADSDITADLIYDYFTYFYEPFTNDREFTYTREYNAKSFGMVFKPSGPFAGLAKKLNMPRDFVFVNRIQWGVVSLLAQLGARNNWHRIHQELLFDGAPATELGHLDHEWRERWRRTRGLSDAKELALTHDGVVRIA